MTERDKENADLIWWAAYDLEQSTTDERCKAKAEEIKRIVDEFLDKVWYDEQ